MRTFIALEIPTEIQEKIGAYIKSINGRFKDVKWVAPYNLHLTIKFLGDVDYSQLDDIKECIKSTASGSNPFFISLHGTGFFPSPKRPKIIWVGANGGAEYMLAMFQKLENHLEKIGFDRETRAFSPHLTIGRVRRYREIVVPENLPEFEHVNFQVNSLALIKSTLTPKGPIYEKTFESFL